MANNSNRIPEIKSFQFDSSGIGNLKNSVNLFRGDVNLTQNLITLPGPLGKSELDVRLSISYQSNITEEAQKWNLDYPTSIVGLGWDMALDRISVDTNSSPTKETNVYYYESQGSKNALVRNLSNPTLADLDLDFKDELENNNKLSPTLHDFFIELGIDIDKNTSVTFLNENSWLLTDSLFQREYVVQKKEDSLTLYDGGESYQLENYQFWKIIYYRKFERWEVTKESGMRFSYGGLAPSESGAKCSKENSIEWSVGWSQPNDGTTTGLWLGESTVTNSQYQYALAWNLTTIQDTWGEKVTYSYNESQSGTVSTGIQNSDIEQLVGDDTGLPYTKACYLTTITDVFGRRIVMKYGDKLYENTSDEAPKEYQDPHRETPDITPNAFQDRYETKFLDQIVVTNQQDELLFSLQLDYCPRPDLTTPESAVANVTTNDGIQLGSTYKRYLTAITQYNNDGDSAPGLKFDYYLDTSQPDNLGAVKNITYPEGGVAQYSYAQPDFPICERKITISPPDEVTDGGPVTPRVWFGSDYVVSVWHNYTTGKVSLQVYTWLGYWQSWQLDPENSIIVDDGTFDISTMNVVAQENFFGLYFEKNSKTNFYLFQKDTAKSGQWLPFQDQSSNSNPIIYQCSSDLLTVYGGNSFILILSRQESFILDRYTFNWSTQNWIMENVITSDNRLFATAYGEYFATLSYQNRSAKVTLHYLDPQLNWNQNETVQLNDFQMSDENEFQMVPGPSLIACSRLRSNDKTQILDYSITLLQWDENYTLSRAFEQEFKDDVSSGELTSTIPIVVNNSFVCCAGHLLRFNGTEWMLNSQLVVKAPRPGIEQRYSYNSDYALQSIYQDVDSSCEVANQKLALGNPVETAKLLHFDPNIHCQEWNENGLIELGNLAYPNYNPSDANWPSAGENYFISGQNIYYQGTSSNWNNWNNSTNPILKIGSREAHDWVNTEDIINASPNYFTYTQNTDEPNSSTIKTLLLSNGFTIIESDFDEEKYYTSDESNTNPGQSPAGNECFVTYPSSAKTFTEATEINLYRYVGNSVSDEIKHYAVSQLAINDGFGQVHYFSFNYDLTSAACDPSGKVIKYYKSFIYPGCQNSENKPFGYIIQEYINGQEQPDPTIAGNSDYYYNMLDGNLLSKSAYDSNGTLVASESYEWSVYKEKWASPAKEKSESLFGGFVCQKTKSTTNEGITTTTTYNYEEPSAISGDDEETSSGLPYSGELIGSISCNFNGEGQEETTTTTNTYGYQEYPFMNARHILEQKVQTTEKVQQGENDPVVKKAMAHTLKPYPSLVNGMNWKTLAVDATFRFLGGGNPVFPFADYLAGQTPSNWSQRHQIARRTLNGHIQQSSSFKNLDLSVLYDINNQLHVAQFVTSNSGSYQCRYLGFEPYEDISSWTMGNNTVISSNDTHLGTQGLTMQEDGTLSTSISLSDSKENYLLGFFLKTPKDFAPSQDTGWTITLNNQANPKTASFEATNGVWKYFSVPITLDSMDFSEDEGAVTIDFLACNNASSQVLIDCIHIHPIRSKFKATIYNSVLQKEMGVITNGGKTTRYIHDNFENKVIQTNSRGDVDSLTCNFLSCEGNEDNSFQPEDPNCNLSIHPALGGHCETFRDGNEWQNRWESPNDSCWQTSGGMLLHTSNTNDTLTLKAFETPANEPDCTGFGVYFELKPTNGPFSDNIGLTIGEGLQIVWNPNTPCWQLIDEGESYSSLVTPTKMAKKWLCIWADKTILFYGEGQLLFSYETQNPFNVEFRLDTGLNLFGIRNLTFLKNPQLSAVFTDATGKIYQEHHLTGSDSLVKQTVFNDLGRIAAMTKAAPASFGNGDNKNPMQFRSTFVNVADFLENINTSGLMTGDVSDYYAGQKENGNKRSNDHGYPYHRIRFNNNPLKQIAEFGLPGADHAIRDMDKTSMDERKTVQVEHQGITGIPFSNSPNAGSYYTTTLVEPLKSKKVTIKDLESKTVGSYSLGNDSAEDTPLACSLSETVYGTYGKIVTKKLPNYFTDGPQSQSSDFINKSVYNMLGKKIAFQDANTGTTVHIYNKEGNLRFSRPSQSEDSETPYILYYKYDSLHRKTETGSCIYQWNEANAKNLKQLAEDPHWPNIKSEPKGSVLPSVIKRHDGDGSDPNSMGHIVSTITFNFGGDSESVVTEEYTYDGANNVKTKSMTIRSKGSTNPVSHSITYHYNNSDQVLSIEYPDFEDDKPSTVVYSYDEMGRLSAIGTSFSNYNKYASYLYDACDNIIQTNLNDGSIKGIFDFNSPGWHKRFQYAVPNQQNGFSFSQNYTFNQDGRIVNIETDSSEQNKLDESFTYNDLKRLKQYVLKSPTDKVQSDLSQEIDYTQYDANGNLCSMEEEKGDLQFEYYPGTDQISNITCDSNQSAPIQYCPSGETHSSPKPNSENGETLTYSYDFAKSRSSSILIEESGETIGLQYDSNGRRVKKESQNSYTLYVHGNNLEPLAKLDQDGVGCYYIYGPTGLVAFLKNSETYFPLKDSIGSTRTVLDSSGNCVAGYNYLPYGTSFKNYGSDPTITNYLYTGQEFDEETNLYNYHARLYNPALKRFNTQDPARQFPSPYLYTGDNPVMSTDPTGEMSTGAQVAIASSMAVLTVIGAVFTLATGGASDAAVGAIDVVVEGATGVAEGATGVAEGAAEERTLQKIKRTMKKACERVTKRSVKNRATNIAIGAGTSSAYDLISQGISGNDINWGDLGVSATIGAFAGSLFEFTDIFKNRSSMRAKVHLVAKLFTLSTAIVGLETIGYSNQDTSESGENNSDENSQDDNTSHSSNNPTLNAFQNHQMMLKPNKTAHLRKILHRGHKKIKLLSKS